MAISTYSIDEVPEEVWLWFRKSGPAGVFYYPELLKIWEEVYDWRSVVYVDGDSGFVSLIKSTIAGKMMFSLPFGWYGGFVGANPSKSFVPQATTDLQRRGYIQENIVQFDSIPDNGAYQRYKSRDLTSHILDITGSDDFSDNTRRNVDKAAANELLTRPLDRSDLDSLLQLMDEHEKLTGKSRKVDSTLYAKLLEVSTVLPNGVRVLGAWSGGGLVACHIYFETETDLFYFDGASNEIGRDLLANFKLFAETIAAARQGEIRRLNFGATPYGDKGLLRFKDSWGAKPVVYREYYRVSKVKGLIDAVRGSR